MLNTRRVGSCRQQSSAKCRFAVFPCVIFWTLMAATPVPRSLRADWFGPETSIQPLEVRASNLIGDHCRK
jgi:hypothetical protein